MLSTTVNNN